MVVSISCALQIIGNYKGLEANNSSVFFLVCRGDSDILEN